MSKSQRIAMLKRQISPRQKEILSLRVEGLTHRQIAKKLGITRGCIGAHMANVRRLYDGNGLKLISRK
jgi:DNA-binding CsgD family transcriptional regulator